VSEYRRKRKAGPWLAIAGAIWLALTLARCSEWLSTTPPQISPTSVGVIASADVRSTSPNVLDITLADGRAITIDRNTSINLDGGLEPEHDALLLVGDGRDGKWYEVLRPSTLHGEGCFGLGRAAREEQGRVVFDTGLVLPLTRDFDPGPVAGDGQFDWPGHEFCINEDGEAAAYD
jgi:hypothetical protein